MAAAVMNIRLKLVNLVDKAKKTIWNLNFFQSIPPTQNALTLRKQHFSTRLFLFLFIFCLITFTVYTSQVAVVQYVTVEKLSYSLYRQLFARYATTLSCPCTTIAIPQKAFLHINVSYHEVCSSAFVQEKWISFLAAPSFFSGTSMEFHHTGGPLFQMLASLCHLATQMIDDELLTFANRPFITADVMSNDLVTEQSLASIDLLISNLETSFMRLIALIRITTTADGLVSGLLTNIDYKIIPYNSYWSQAVPIPHTFQETNCTCFQATTCTVPAFVTSDGNASGTILGYIPGLYIGCYIIDGLLQSTLELLFDQNEIDRLIILLFNKSSTYSKLFPALNQTRLQRFTVQTSGNELASRLFVVTWTKIVSHENYFYSCQPVKCQYSFVSKNKFIVTVTIVLGIIGGLNTILELVAPLIIQSVFWIKKKFIHSNANSSSVQNEVRHPLRTQIRTGLITLKNFIVQYNMFPSNAPVVHEYETQSQRISTFLFIILMCISFLILAVYTALEKVTTTVTNKQLNYSTYQTLSLQYPQSLSCLCTTISFEQGMFIDIKPTFHPICSSDFVSSEFLNYLTTEPAVSRWYAYSRFLFIDSLCRLSNESISDSLVTFKKARFISGEVLSSDFFFKHVKEMADNYIQTIINSFMLSFSFIRRTTIENRLMNGFALNAIILVPPNPPLSGSLYYTALYTDFCDCLLESCTQPVGVILLSGLPFLIPGFYWGCYVVDFTLRSDLQCFYDLNCTTLFLSVYKSQMNFNISTLNASTTRFSEFTSINNLFEELFVENWTTNISHVDYFNQCKPSSCSYTIQTKNNLLTILTITIGLLGGIQIVLQFIVPKVVKLVYKRCCIKHDTDTNRETAELSHENARTSALKNLKTVLSNYNIFPTFQQTTNADMHRNHIIATRLFIVVFTASLISIAIFNLLAPIETTVDVNSPTYKEYLHWYDKYEQNLECPCTSIAVPYSDFMKINFSFHQICSSVYVESVWPRIIYSSSRLIIYRNPMHFSIIGGPIFQTIASFCQLSNNSVNNALISFSSQQLISNNIIPKNIFSEQTNASLTLFLKSMESDFQRLSKFFRNITISNVFISLTLSNLLLFEIFDNDNKGRITTLYTSYSVNNSITEYCSCQPPSICIGQLVISPEKLHPVPGMVAACFPVESARKSTLVCFFNQTCIDELRALLNETTVTIFELNTTALDDSLPSRYSPETKIEEMFNQMMIENVNWSASHEQYYENCRPSMCSYTIKSRKDTVYVLTMVLGLTGGLSGALRVIIPYVVKFSSKLINRLFHCNQRRTQVQPF